MAKGYKTGGRKKGVPNKVTGDLLADIKASGESPLEYMIRVMRDTTVDHERRDRMAAAAAPYCHQKLASTEVTGKDGAPLMPERSPREIARIVLGILQKAANDDDDAS